MIKREKQFERNSRPSVFAANKKKEYYAISKRTHSNSSYMHVILSNILVPELFPPLELKKKKKTKKERKQEKTNEKKIVHLLPFLLVSQ